MRLDDYLDSSGAGERTAVHGCLDAMAAHGDAVDDTQPSALRRMSENLRADHRPPEHIWADLCTRLGSCAPGVPAVYETVREWGRTNDYAFLIPVACLGPDAILAHILTVQDFARRLSKTKGRFRDEATARMALLSWLARPDVDYHRRRLHGVYFRGHLMWATFDPGDQRQDPCTSLANQATTICASLALDRQTVGHDLLALCYTLPAPVAACFPTVMAAACGKSWNESWAPADEGEAHGWTQPWAGHADAHRCPEVVHKPVEGSSLALPARRIKA